MQEFSETDVQDKTRAFFQKVFGWMFLGLIISGAVAFATYTLPGFSSLILGNPFILIVLVILQLGLVLLLTWLLRRISATTAVVLFLVYSFITGLTLSTVFIVYTLGSVVAVFFIAAAMFGVMALIGFVTRLDLSKLGVILFMGLVGIILALIVNIFLRSQAFDFIISIIGVIIFTGLTAFDVQRIKKGSLKLSDDPKQQMKASISGALSLYLDFINLFLQLLRLFGKRR
ncbi:Bax inhibitor-1/YccA family protein [Patescibacteria group bacterium]|nr:Bax inhibitor-1/YccA family protein [Patescibacteria group bacterium]